MPKEISRDFERNQKQLMKLLDQLKKHMQKLDPTLQGAVETARRKIEYQLDKLRRKTGRAQDAKSGLLSGHENFLEHLLFPHKTVAVARVVPVAVSGALGAGRVGGVAEDVRKQESWQALYCAVDLTVVYSDARSECPL